MGAPKMFHLHDVPTKIESIERLEELATRYNSWLEAHSKRADLSSEPFKFIKQEPVDDEENDEGSGGEDDKGDGGTGTKQTPMAT